MKRTVALLSTIVFLLALSVVAQQMQHKKPEDKSKRPSPPATAEMAFANGKKITIDYSSPRMRGRKIMGGLVPYGKIWRTGANEATSFVTESDLDINGTKVPAGKYTLYTLPGADAWKLIINKQTGQWGLTYHEDQDLARIDMKLGKPKAPVEDFTISFVKHGPKAADLVMEWENTRLVVPIKEEK